ncbi:MAG: flagellar assembly protein FliH [Gammaproteobacteria bacterium]|uniref:FliH/SctL family protein n=1 Tax=Rhodoferax sp. TaxID=50421 RepID=UPI0017E842D6|nr:flagellar assembly protein FliH [Rhodoferax sp.]MBU3900460.1 flagellar assembly protein FliH [Gammaproteobacteria bacterium]MBA3059927.1 flagellar assembly protein FliH [Rhodoferax sp.]MBU3997136.1 flagellar assembly protein FliH [Gammaproteobacteria bacterium]MBU4079905.1 flagellar assembly protein FliH [Gammaproteobacteria bacterium]MBU4112920.1 flagellar assembly protein FliH [Gammaproteobacteria bacterium]
MRNYSRFIPGEEIDAAEPWSFASVDTAALLLAAQVKARDEAADEFRNEACKQEGYAQGFAQGHAQATVEAQHQIADFMAGQGAEAARAFAQLLVAAQAQLAEAEQVMAQGTLELACELARQVLRRELTVDLKAVQPVLREALGLLVADSKSAVLRLHPLDLAALEEVIRNEFSGLSLTLVPDVAMSRGGCLVESAGTVVDGTLEKRWQRAVANLGLASSWQEPPHEQ